MTFCNSFFFAEAFTLVPEDNLCSTPERSEEFFLTSAEGVAASFTSAADTAVIGKTHRIDVDRREREKRPSGNSVCAILRHPVWYYEKNFYESCLIETRNLSDIRALYYLEHYQKVFSHRLQISQTFWQMPKKGP
ncbi:MAG: hypothetical protein ABF572_06950 [Gluconobacter sp.]|uniref:hypothetical protein n=1 Tax=Gluconobacter sp. TaxID=1876758 RepID=UPI0039EA8D85